MHTLITNLAENENTLTVVVTLLGVAWTSLKSSAWFRMRRKRQFGEAVEILEAAVEETYRVYVRSMKEGRADGKLTENERRRARLLARERAILLAKREGLDLLRLIGEDRVNLWIAKLVKRLKAA